MTNAEIAAVLGELADLLEFQGANPFRVRAYRQAARTVEACPDPLADRHGDPARPLTDLPGIGDDLAGKIGQLLDSGRIDLLEQLRAELPPTVLDLLRVPGLGPKRAAQLYKELGIATLDQLREACEAQRIRGLKGFGAKTEETIAAGIALALQSQQRILWCEAEQIVVPLMRHLSEVASTGQLAAAGSFRRGKDTVGDLDLLAVARDGAALMDRLAAYPGVEAVLARGDTKMSVRCRGTQIDLRIVPEESFGAALQYFTGSKEHNIVLRHRAKQHGLKINEYGVFRDEQYIAGRTEEEVYAALGLPWIPPELREARREFEWADAGALPALIEAADLRGDLHAHTDWSDGLNTIAEMAEAARARGLSYLAITDHSQRVSMAGGLDADRLRRQWDEIDRLNARWSDFTLLRGIEVDILERGGLDLPDDLLAEADWVVASVHYGQRQPREQITRRIVDALAHPAVCAIAHPTGRMLLRRDAYLVDLDAVFEAARAHGKLLELNAHPNRLDLDDLACAAAKARGVGIVISSDAHNTEGLGVVRYGILQARRAGLVAADVANTAPWPELTRRLGRV